MKWQKNMRLIDANVILRYLLMDNQEMAYQAKEIIDTGAYAKPEIIAEVVYVLKGVYKINRQTVSIYIKTLLKSIYCEESAPLIYALNLYADSTLDFIDCLLVAYQALNNESVFTFDKKLNKYLANI